MSGKATGWVWDHARGLDPTSMLVLLAVAEAADHNGEGSFQSKATLAGMLSISERTVQRQLSELVDAGFLEVQAPARRHRPTTYCLPGMRGDAHVSRGTPPDPVDDPVDNLAGGEAPVSPQGVEGRRRGDTGVIRALYGTGNTPLPPRGGGDGDAGVATAEAAPDFSVVDLETGRTVADAFLAEADPRPAVRAADLAQRVGWQLARGYTVPELMAALRECHSFTTAAIDGRCRAVRARSGPGGAQDMHPAGRGREAGVQPPLLALREDRPPCLTCHGAGVVLDDDLLARKCEDCS